MKTIILCAVGILASVLVWASPADARERVLLGGNFQFADYSGAINGLDQLKGIGLKGLYRTVNGFRTGVGYSMREGHVDGQLPGSAVTQRSLELLFEYELNAGSFELVPGLGFGSTRTQLYDLGAISNESMRSDWTVKPNLNLEFRILDEVSFGGGLAYHYSLINGQGKSVPAPSQNSFTIYYIGITFHLPILQPRY